MAVTTKGNPPTSCQGWHRPWQMLGGILGIMFLNLAGRGAGQELTLASTPLLTASNLAQVREWARLPGETIRMVAGEGIVAGCFPEWSLLILHDQTGNAGLKLDLQRLPLMKTGERVAIQGPARLGGGEVSLQPKILVNNDGLHAAQEARATVHLTPGMHPLEARYFQFLREMVLQVDYEGPHTKRQALPSTRLYRATAAETMAGNYSPGLDYDYYQGIWDAIPDFNQLLPVKSGVTENLSLSPRQRDIHFGMRFAGYLKVEEPGDYTFYLNSDDGAQLIVEENPVTVTMLGAPGTWPPESPAPVEAGQSMPGKDDYWWATAEGTVKFIGPTGRGWLVEISSEGALMEIYLGSKALLPAGMTINTRIRASGFCEGAWDARGRRVPGRLLVGETNGRLVLEPATPPQTPKSGGDQPLPVLTAAEQVRALKPAEAARSYPVRLRGIITVQKEKWEGIIQDASSAVYVRFHLKEAEPPPVGSFCELTGVTEPGGFAPVVAVTQAIRLGRGQFPAPLHPGYSQLGSGSMDCLWVELQGMVRGVEPEERVLRVAVKGGAVTAVFQANGDLSFLGGLSNAFVRIRGCVIPGRNVAGQLTREVYLWVPASACVTVDQLAAADPFDSPLKMISELSLFDPNPNYYQMTRVRGQLLHLGKSQWYFTDGTNELRIMPKNPPVLTAGDLVEAVGLPELSAGSPLLREALVRQTGHAPLPPPEFLNLDQVSQPENDARWARVEGRLIEIQTSPTRMVLWLQAGLVNIPATLTVNLPINALPPPGSRLSLCGVVAQVPGEDATHGGNGGLELNSVADITCLELPPFWTPRRTLLAMGSLAGILLMAGLWIYFLRRTVRLRTRALRQEMNERQNAEEKVRVFQTESALEEQRARIARNIHDDLGARVTKLNLLASQPPGNETDYQTHLGKISTTSRAMVEALDETVWAVNPVNDSLLRLADYVMHYAQDFFRNTEMLCQLDIPIDLPELAVTAEFRFHLFLVVKEALNNVLKHSKAHRVLVKMRAELAQLCLSIQDDGCGFDPASVPRRNGLSNLQNRVKGLGGIINIESSPGSGTKITVTVPLPAAHHKPAQ